MQMIVKFLKCCWKGLNFIRDVVMNIVFLFFVLLLAAIVSLTTMVKEKPNLTGDQGALLVNLNGYLADEREDGLNWRNALKKLNDEQVASQYSTFDVVYAIENAANDERIKGLVLDLNYLDGGDLPALDYVGKAIRDFQKSGKKVIAYADNYSQSQYFLASYADEIYLNPIGEVGIEGLSAQNLYFKSMLEKLEITPHVFRVGTYKSAVEPLLRDDMSPEAKANTEQWLGTMWSNYQERIAENRNIAKNSVLPEAGVYVDELKALNGDITAYAQKHKFVTQVASRLKLSQNLTALFGENEQNEPKMVDFDTYLAALPDRLKGDSSDFVQAKNKIAVINIEGTIVDGETNEQGVGGDSIAQLLREAYKDKNVKAVVLRVNSPGGSAFASEVIRQEAENLQTAGKPVVVSMGAMAASGGYWISSTADYIVADKNTLTGSIGIFAVLPTLENTIKKAGISADGVTTSALVSPSGFSPLTAELKDSLQLQIEHGYERFLSVVSKGRSLTKQQVDNVAQGRVWLGEDAYKMKLVDELGDFDTAVRKAQELANGKLAESEKTDTFSVEWITDENTGLLGGLMKNITQSSQNVIQNAVLKTMGLPKEVKQLQKQLGILTQFNDPKGQYLYCLNCSEVK
ncbi:signal peptide peptidase SppA [Basfia succiniciproducens]|uniref:Signal peptide peptidase A. Serine peptidase. MEROPS family S49 n=1 Tax=Basfia succiniciproducens TaxID=653940 RepID=A0A1G5AC44_9PAST|nr:signal peptide peptidase SppA [Basfia succiniciproducens]QIM68486.1 signal peptide peptidase SppA [Basfia succiniciproducens]SCX75446.1 signal peptide peptidase A. Serine peptidase. MEROPS family S49 [Basfia succiniciproducens]